MKVRDQVHDRPKIDEPRCDQSGANSVVLPDISGVINRGLPLISAEKLSGNESKKFVDVIVSSKGSLIELKSITEAE